MALSVKIHSGSIEIKKHSLLLEIDMVEEWYFIKQGINFAAIKPCNYVQMEAKLSDGQEIID